MADKISKIKPRRLSQGWRKHMRRIKSAARKNGATPG